MDDQKNWEAQFGQSISNALSHVSDLFSEQERLQAALQPASDWYSDLFSEQERLQAALQPASDQWTKVGQVKKDRKRTKSIIRQSRRSKKEVKQSDFMGEVITEPDYDRAEHFLQKDEINTPKNDLLPPYQLHPVIVQNVWTMFLQGNYDPAVFAAFKEVEIAIREVGNYAETDYGTDLMRRAFNPKNGNLTDQSQQEAERIARSALFAGAIGSCKNPLSHRKVDLTMEEAAELIFFASYLLRIVDSCSRSEED